MGRFSPSASLTRSLYVHSHLPSIFADALA